MINLTFHSTNADNLSQIRNDICENAITQIEDGDMIVTPIRNSDLNDVVFTLGIKTSNTESVINIEMPIADKIITEKFPATGLVKENMIRYIFEAHKEFFIKLKGLIKRSNTLSPESNHEEGYINSKYIEDLIKDLETSSTSIDD